MNTNIFLDLSWPLTSAWTQYASSFHIFLTYMFLIWIAKYELRWFPCILGNPGDFPRTHSSKRAAYGWGSTSVLRLSNPIFKVRLHGGAEGRRVRHQCFCRLEDLGHFQSADNSVITANCAHYFGGLCNTGRIRKILHLIYLVWIFLPWTSDTPSHWTYFANLKHHTLCKRYSVEACIIPVNRVLTFTRRFYCTFRTRKFV